MSAQRCLSTSTGRIKFLVFDQRDVNQHTSARPLATAVLDLLASDSHRSATKHQKQVGETIDVDIDMPLICTGGAAVGSTGVAGFKAGEQIGSMRALASLLMPEVVPSSPLPTASRECEQHDTSATEALNDTPVSDVHALAATPMNMPKIGDCKKGPSKVPGSLN